MQRLTSVIPAQIPALWNIIFNAANKTRKTTKKTNYTKIQLAKYFFHAFVIL